MHNHQWDVIVRGTGVLPKFLFFPEQEVVLQLRRCKECGEEQAVQIEPTGNETILNTEWLKGMIRQ